MESYKDAETIRRLAGEYGMLEEDVRHMLAFQSGHTTGDVKTDDPRKSLAWDLWKHLRASFARHEKAYRKLN